MGTITLGSIVDKVQQTLIEADPTTGAGTAGIYWPRVTLVSYANEAMEQISSERMDAYVLTGPLQLVGGVKQQIDGNAVILQKALRNKGPNGDIDGPAITPVTMEVLNRSAPNWPIDTPSQTVIHYMYDLNDPRRFYVWPPVPVQKTYIEVQQSFVTPTIAEGDTIPLEDTWQTAIYYFTIARAYEKSTTRGDLNKSAEYLSLFRAELGLEEEARTKVQPDQQPKT